MEAAAWSPLGAPASGPAPGAADTGAKPLLSTGAGPNGPTLIDEEGREVILKGLSVFGFNSV